MSEQDNLHEADGKKELAVSVENQEDSTTKQEVTPEIEETENDDKVISEIEESNAEDAEDEGSIDRHSIDKKDYEKMSLEALADELEQLVKNQKVQAIKTHVEEIRSEFKSKFSTLLDEKKEEFLNDGGNEIDFYYSNPTQNRYKDAIKEYRTKLNAHYKSLETSLKEN